MAGQDEDTVTVKESTWRRINKKADAHEAELKEKQNHGVALVKEGKVGAGVLEIGGAWAPLITAAAVSAGLYYISENKSFRELDFVRKHWWVRGFVAALVAIGLWKKGYVTWAMAVASSAMSILLADYKNRDEKDKKDAGDPEDAGEAGYWIGDLWYPHYRWDEPRRLEMARERWDERLGGLRRAEQTADRVFTGG
jgi:hypothetical protein